MYLPPAYEGHSKSEKKGITDTIVLVVTTALLILTALFPFLRATAEISTSAEISVTDEQLAVQTKKSGDYTTLVSNMFEESEGSVLENAVEYIKDIDRHRTQIAQGIRENGELTQSLNSLTENLSEELRGQYDKEIERVTIEVEKLKRDISVHTDDTLLTDAIIEKYNLHRPIIDRLVAWVRREDVAQTLDRLEEKTYSIRREIALLYIKVSLLG